VLDAKRGGQESGLFNAINVKRTLEIVAAASFNRKRRTRLGGERLEN
jgi:hypothetical protein